MTQPFTAGNILSYFNKTPIIGSNVFIAPSAYVIGDVRIADKASLWFGCVLRGDEGPIRIGERTNIQDGVIIHSDTGESVTVGDDVTIGHGAIIHGCTVEAWALVGMGAVVLGGAVIESGAFVAAGAVVSPGKRLSKNMVWAGCPAKPVREVSEDLRSAILESPEHYSIQAGNYLGGNVVAVG